MAQGRSYQSAGVLPISYAIQTVAAINPGYPGVPLLDSSVRLIGVNTAIYSPSGAYAGIGFAIPVDTVRRVVRQVIEHGAAPRPHIGVSVSDPVSREVTARLGVPGLMVMGVEPNSPAAAAGLRGTQRAENGELIPGDVIQKIGDREIKSANDLFAAVAQSNPGDTVPVIIFRDGKTMTVELRLLAPPQQ